MNKLEQIIHTINLLEDYQSKVEQYPKGSDGYSPVDQVNFNTQAKKLDVQLTEFFRVISPLTYTLNHYNQWVNPPIEIIKEVKDLINNLQQFK